MRPLTQAEQADLKRLRQVYRAAAPFQTTRTVLGKNNPDATADIREAAREAELVDYGNLTNGAGNGLSIEEVPVVSATEIRFGRVRFYRTAERGDPRFSICGGSFTDMAEIDEMWAFGFDDGRVCVVQLGAGAVERAVLYHLGDVPNGLGGQRQPLRPIGDPPVETVTTPARPPAEVRQAEWELVRAFHDQLLARHGVESGKRAYRILNGALIESDVVVP